MTTRCCDCPYFKHCKSLCPEAESYADQDNHPEAWFKIKSTDKIEMIQPTFPEKLSTTEIILQFYFIDRMDVREIAKKTFKSRQYVHRIIKRYSQIIKQTIKKTIK
jgi:DNA-directed RNA polymerase specialized sigma subunit